MFTWISPLGHVKYHAQTFFCERDLIQGHNSKNKYLAIRFP
jgi:hypothetical protein